MQLRPYQIDCVAAIHDHFTRNNRVAVELATGCGKTVIFADVARDWQAGRVMVIAHRKELLSQAAKKIKAATGEMPAIEQGDLTSNESPWMRSQFVVASKDSLHPRRLAKFDGIGLLIIDEAHRAARKNLSYSKIIDGLIEKNPDLKVLGVSATFKRHDDAAMGQVFDSVAYRYDILDAIKDGYLVDIRAELVRIDSLDISGVKTHGDDFNEKQLAKVMENEENVQGMADAAWRETQDRNCVLGFTASVAQAKEMSDQMNRRQPGCSEWLDGNADDERRTRVLRAFETGDIKYLFNCNLFLEGYDNPNIDALLFCKPTRSPVAFKQMLGRGTRTLEGTVEGIDTAEERKAAIAASAKPDVLVLDFVGNSGRHKLISCVDILAGEYCDEVQLAAMEALKEAAKANKSLNVNEALADAESKRQAMIAIIAEQQRKEAEAKAKQAAEELRLRQEEEEKKRQKIVAKAEYNKRRADLFDNATREGGPPEAGDEYRCPIGKHKGKPLRAVPTGWLRWAVDNNINTWQFRAKAEAELKIRVREFSDDDGYKRPAKKPEPKQQTFDLDEINRKFMEASGR